VGRPGPRTGCGSSHRAVDATVGRPGGAVPARHAPPGRAVARHDRLVRGSTLRGTLRPSHGVRKRAPSGGRDRLTAGRRVPGGHPPAPCGATSARCEVPHSVGRPSPRTECGSLHRSGGRDRLSAGRRGASPARASRPRRGASRPPGARFRAPWDAPGLARSGEARTERWTRAADGLEARYQPGTRLQAAPWRATTAWCEVPHSVGCSGPRTECGSAHQAVDATVGRSGGAVPAGTAPPVRQRRATTASSAPSPA
jgi:hypothetical protein